MRIATPQLIFLLLLAFMLLPSPCARADAAGIKLHADVEKLASGQYAIHLHWTCTRDDVSSFEVEEKCNDASGTNFHLVYLAPGGRTGEFVETEVEAGVHYDFRIRADYNNADASGYR